MIRTALLLLVLLLLWGCEALFVDVIDGGDCLSDLDCVVRGAEQVCVIGVCVDADNSALDQVHLEVRPSDDSDLAPQQLLEVATVSGDPRAEIVLRSTSLARGRVLDEASGAGLPAQVVAVQQGGIPGRALVVTTTSDGPEGRFSLPLVADETYSLSFWPNDTRRAPAFYADFVASAGGSSSYDDNPVAFPDAESLRLLEGRVVAGEGSATLGVEGVELRLLDGSRRVSSLARTDSTGQWQLWLPEDVSARSLTLEARPTAENRLVPTVSQTLVPVDVSAPVVLDLGALGAPVPFTGVVADVTGVPVVDAKLFINGSLGGGSFAATVLTDAAGRFDEELRPGRYELVVVGPTPGNAGLLAGYTVDLDVETSLIALNLPLRVLMSGAVLDAAGAPVANATISLRRVGELGGEENPALEGLGWTFTTVTDIDGSFSQYVDPGRYRVTIEPDSSTTRPRLSALLEVAEDSLVHRFTLPPSRVVAGRIVREDGQPVAGAAVSAYAPFVGEDSVSLELGATQCKADGSFELLLPELQR